MRLIHAWHFMQAQLSSLGVPLACDDDRCGNPPNRSLVSLAVTLGQTLKIRVGSAAETWGVGHYHNLWSTACRQLLYCEWYTGMH